MPVATLIREIRAIRSLNQKCMTHALCRRSQVPKHLGQIYLVPSTVNFYNADIYEGSSPVYTNGYFCLYDTKMPPHGTNGPHHMLEEVVDGKGTLCKDADEITGVADIIDTHISGDLYWIMNWSFAVGSGQQKELEGIHIRQNNHIEFPADMATLSQSRTVQRRYLP